MRLLVIDGSDAGISAALGPANSTPWSRSPSWSRTGSPTSRSAGSPTTSPGDVPDGLSLPAQREACAPYAADHAIGIVGEYIERGESARTADRPEFQAMLARIQRHGDVRW
jgi:hypothetical protein